MKLTTKESILVYLLIIDRNKSKFDDKVNKLETKILKEIRNKKIKF